MRESYGGENGVILYLGANGAINMDSYSSMLKDARPGDYLVVQNEMNDVGELLRYGKALGMITVFNPAPHPPNLDAGKSWSEIFPTDILIINKAEASMIWNFMAVNVAADFSENGLQNTIMRLQKMTGCSKLILTMSGEGVAGLFAECSSMVRLPAIKCDVVDTTGAGDTFLGYFVASLLEGRAYTESLVIGCTAASITISQIGAFHTIPSKSEVDALLMSSETV